MKLKRVALLTNDKVAASSNTDKMSPGDKDFIKIEKLSKNISFRKVFFHEDLYNNWTRSRNWVILYEASMTRLPSGWIMTPIIFDYTTSGYNAADSFTHRSQGTQFICCKRSKQLFDRN